MKLKNLLLLLILGFSSSWAFGQKTVTGTVTDRESGEPLIGANILIIGQGSGTVTDIDGSFELKIPKDATELEVSYTGYAAEKVKIGNSKVVNITLAAGENLEEVVVIGYGVVDKRDVTGAIASIKPEDEETAQYDNFQQLLQGRASGVYVQSNSNELGAPNTIRIRGTNSLRGDNEPLYVVDGIIINSSTEDTADPLSGGSSYLSPQNGLNGINPQDIESIEILKDASATAIYGSRGANGVILITTKKGKAGKAKFNYKATTRTGKATNLIDVLNTSEYVDYQNEFRAAQGFSPNFYTYPDGSIAEFVESAEFMEANADSLPRVSPVNWYDDILQNSFSQTHRLTVSGGTEQSDYYVAAGFGDAKGIIPGTQATQGDILINFSQKLNDKLEISPRISASFNRNLASKGTENLGSSNTSIIKQIILSAPLVGFSGNNLTEDIEDVIDGPRAWLTDYDDVAKELRALASLKLDYKISEVFTYRFLAGGDYRNKTRQLWYGTSLQRGRLANGEAGISQLNRIRYNIDNTLMFKKKYGRNHRINGTMGVVLDGTNSEQSTFAASNFANKDLRFDGIRFGQVYQPLFYNEINETILSFLGRVNYSYQNKYLLTVSFRGDGTSKFAKGNKFSFFPSAAFAWKLMEEDFLKDSNLFSDAKFRVGYGRTGSQAINAYQTFSRFGPTANLLSDGQGGGVTAIVPQNLANPDLIWETTDQFNAGLDFGFLNDRFTGNIDVYHKKTKDLLQQLSIGSSAGFETFITNQGSLINKGLELGLVANILQDELKWSVSGNISFNRNEISELGLPPAQFGTQIFSAFLGRVVSGGTAFKVPANIFIEGQPTGLFWGFETDGIINTTDDLANAAGIQGIDPQLGDIFYVDQNNDGVINEQDLTTIGNPNPDFTYGIGSQWSYKGLSLSLFINGVFGNEIANGNLAREDFALGNSNNVRTQAYYGAWREGVTNATHPRLGYDLQGDFTDRFVEDGSFMRLTYVTLGYDLPVQSIKGIDAASIFVSGHNLLLLTNYSGFDPEVNSFSFDPSRQGIDWGSFPNQKSFVVGLNISL